MHEVNLADELNEFAKLLVLAINALHKLVLLKVIVEVELIKFDLTCCDGSVQLQGLASIVRRP